MTVYTIFETAWALRGYEQLLTDFVMDPGLADVSSRSRTDTTWPRPNAWRRWAST